MAGKNGKAQRKRGRKRGKRKALTKKQKDVVETIVEEKLKEDKETKYVNNFTHAGQGTLNNYETLTEVSAGVDTAYSRVYKKLNVVIPEGDDYKSRDGDKVMLKSLQLRFRIKPQDAYDFIAAGSVISNDWFSKPEFRGYILRVDKASNLGPADLDQCLRRPTENWMDTRQTSGRSMRKAFTIVHKFKLDVKYRHVMSVIDPGASSKEGWMIKVPEITHKTIVANINKKLLFNASGGNEPLKYDYYMFMTYRPYLADSYTVTTFPAYINYWTSYTFQDI